MDRIIRSIATLLAVDASKVEAAVRLLDEGSTVPFIARYRKEATGGLDDAQLRKLEERLHYLRELEERRQTILKSIEEQGKLTPGLRAAIEAAETKTRLEDLYLPYKKKRRTKAQIAREAGLEPLALALLDDPSQVPSVLAAGYCNPEADVADADAALEGARHILIERFSEQPEVVGELRTFLRERAVVRSRCVAGKEEEAAKFSDYFEHEEPLAGVPSHRALALLRGRKEGLLKVEVAIDTGDDAARNEQLCVSRITNHFGIRNEGRPADSWLLNTAGMAWRARVFPHLESELTSDLRDASGDEAIRVFGLNLRELLLAAPAGVQTVIGLDPGFRTGVKVGIVDGTGKVLETRAIYPHAPRNDWQGSISVLAKLAAKHGATLVSIGNGTASRETDRLVGELIKKHPDLNLTKVVVSEAGASVYSASQVATDELPELDVSLRGAVSIARRLQDPLAELVKIEPKSIGVGQYQHDVDQSRLGKRLDAVVEDCVNAVGVDVNTASPALLTHVSGLTPTLARNIVAHRDANGPFPQRKKLLDVPRLGAKAFEQAAGFLRIPSGDNPLDASAVHPEAYPVVERIVAKTGRPVAQLVGAGEFLKKLAPADFTDETFGVPTVTDILSELEKPGRDPRPEFVTPKFEEGVEELKDLKPDMILEGVVSNVTNFGAFVDIGVHQDGLVHVSNMSDRFIEDPHEIVKPGQVVKVKVLDVDIARKRIALTLRMNDTSREHQEAQAQKSQRRGGDRRRGGGGERPARRNRRPEPEIKSPLAEQLEKLKGRFK